VRKNRAVIIVPVVLVMLALLAGLLITGCGGESGDKESPESTEDSAVEDAGGNEPVEVDPGQMSSTPESTGPSNSEQALEQARAEGKPALLKFGSGTCLPCIQIDENIEEVRPEYEGKAAIIIVDLNDRSEYDLAMEYNIQTIPTTIFFKKDGSIANGYVGVMTPEQLRNELNSII